jgi:hypothetical protein
MADAVGGLAGAAIAAAAAAILMLVRVVRLSKRGSLFYLAFSLIVGAYFGQQYHGLLRMENRAVEALNDSRQMEKILGPALNGLPQGPAMPYAQGENIARKTVVRFASAFGLEEQSKALQDTAVNTLLDMRGQDVYAQILVADFKDYLRARLPGSLASRLSLLMVKKRAALQVQGVVLLLLGAGVSIIVTLRRGRLPPEAPFDRPERLPA